MNGQRRLLWRCNLRAKGLNQVRQQSKWIPGGRVFHVEGKAHVKLLKQKCGWCIPLISRKRVRNRLGERENSKKWDQRGSQGPENSKDLGFLCNCYRKPLESLYKTVFVLKGSLTAVWGTDCEGEKWKRRFLALVQARDQAGSCGGGQTVSGYRRYLTVKPIGFADIYWHQWFFFNIIIL